jgi:2-iminoacetate synthase
MDYANPKVAEKGWKVIEDNMAELHNEKQVIEVRKRIERIKQGERDLYF